MQRHFALALQIVCFTCLSQWASAQPVRVDCFQLRAPGDTENVNQASDLYYGKLGERDGLWTACDRNGTTSAGKIYFISKASLKRGVPDKNIVADDAFTIVPPDGEWSAFAAANRNAGDAVLTDLRRRITAEGNRGDEPYLDLEALTIAPSPMPPHDLHVFAVAEESYSTVLELSLEDAGRTGKARLVAVYAYHEAENEHGTDHNDGLEGLAYAGKIGEFFFAEEGTKDVDGHATARLFFLDPRLGRARLYAGTVEVEAKSSEALTIAVRAQRKGRSQTLNALTALPDGRLLAVDRNGGLILRIDPEKQTVERWLNLYDMGGINLREKLAKFPRERHMPYVSIEGVALDDTGALWLVDDPAMPEGFRESCLVRITGTSPTTRP